MYIHQRRVSSCLSFAPGRRGIGRVQNSRRKELDRRSAARVVVEFAGTFAVHTMELAEYSRVPAS